MEGRCSVETCADFGFLDASFTPKITPGLGTDVFLLTGSEEVHVFNREKRKVTLVLQFPGPVSDLVQSPDKQLLYVSCSCGVHCVRPQILMTRTQNCPADASSGPVELKISSDSLVIGEEGVLSLLLVGSVLLLLSRRDTSWLLSLYKTPEPAGSSSCELLGSVSLPVVSAAVCGNDEGKTRTRRRPALICVHSSSTPPSEETSQDSHYHLESVLFKLLFGVDAALAKSPVILCGLPDGRLCSLPLRLPGSRFRVLHSLEQPVVFVGASVTMETAPGHAQCLVAAGEQGRVLLMRTEDSEGGDRAAGFLERRVSGPVLCGSVDKQHLYYSTGSDLLMLDLSENSSRGEGQEMSEETSRKSSADVHSPTSLKVCRVSALAAPSHDPTGAVELLSLSVRGQLQKILLPEERKDAGPSGRPAVQACRGIRDLLSAIGDVCERVSAQKTAIKSKNHILKHLNQVLNISFLLMERSEAPDQPAEREKLIRCHAKTRWSRLLQKDSLNLTCVLENSSSFTLERGWTLGITVFPVFSSLAAGEESSSTNFSSPLHNLRPGETLDVSLPLAAAGDASFPMRVSCSLIFSLYSLLGEQEIARLPGFQSSCISLPLNTLTVDWLHVLQVDITSRPLYVEVDPIQAFLSSHQIEGIRRVEGGGGGGGVSKAEQEVFSASIRVSSELLRDTLVSDLNPQGPKSDLCMSLLEWLLSQDPGGGMKGHQGDKVDLSSSVVHARGPNGARVKLTAMEVNVGDEDTGKDDSLSTVEVQVESPSMAAVCGLHHAVLRRIQALMLSAPERATSTTRLQSLGLRPALQRAERLLHQIQQTRVSGAFGVGVSAGRTTTSLLAAYRELRQNPLLIL